MNNTHDKVIKDGKVAVLYSPSYGAGWYSWNPDYPEILFNPDIVNLVLEAGKLGRNEIRGKDFLDKVEVIIKELCEYGDCYTGGAENLEVYWVPEGYQFEITVHHGYETVDVLGESTTLIA